MDLKSKGGDHLVGSDFTVVGVGTRSTLGVDIVLFLEVMEA